jgi:hypothetical protein
MSKVDPKEIAKAIKDKLVEIADSVIAGDDNKNQQVTVKVEVDEEKLAKSITSEIDVIDKSQSHDEDDEDDDDTYEDIYDEMSDKELKKACQEKKISVFTKTTPEMMKTKLRKYDVDKANENNDDDNDNDEKSLKDKQKSFQDSVDKLIKDSGIDPKLVKVEVAGTKKSQETDKSSPGDNDDDEDKVYADGANDAEFAKDFNELSEDDKDDAVGNYLSESIRVSKKG